MAADSTSGRLEVSKVGGATVLAPSGSLTFETCEEFEQALISAAEGPETDVIIECKHIKLMDSRALELLVRSHQRLSDQGKNLKLIGLGEVCRDILMVTRLGHVLQVHDDFNSAISARGDL